MLLTLLLFVALLSVGLGAAIERIDFQIRRDREEELIHRGVEYSRAIRRFVKKFGRYPTAVEELENTNNMHFLRKRYKDPINGQDFKIIYALTPAAPTAPAKAPAASLVRVHKTPRPGEQNSVVVTDGADSTDPSAQDPAADGQAGADGQPEAADASSTSDPANPEQKPENASDSTERVFGGPPMLGVASRSKKKSIREFNKKDHYDQWQFVYDPTTDRGGLMVAPSQPALNNSVQAAK
jgi:hypothetical protein